MLEKRLEQKEYVVGNGLTIADLTLASSLMYAQQVDAPLGEFPNVKPWHARITAQEGWKKTAS